MRYMVRGMDNDDFPANILGVQVAEHGPDSRVVTVSGEVDALTAPKLAATLTAQLVCNSPNASMALEVSGLREYFAMADSVPEALNK